MMFCAFIFVLLSQIFVFWTVTEPFGQKKGQFGRLILVLISIFMIKPLLFVIVAAEISLFMYFRGKKRQSSVVDELFFADELILHMKTGSSLELSIQKISAEHGDFLKTGTNGLASVISFCRNNSSLAYRVIFFFRTMEKLRQKLHTKQKTLSLQSKAQAIVSFFLYIIVFSAQWAWNDDFRKILSVPSGRLVLISSFGFLCLGVYFVFRCGRCTELEL